MMYRYLGPNLKGIVFGAAFGVISSSCSYGSAAAVRGFYQQGADLRAIFSFLISSTNMNVAILILFWSLLGWKFAFAEFFGGIIIIAVVATGFTVLFGPRELDRLRRERPGPPAAASEGAHDCHAHGMHEPAEVMGALSGWSALREVATWRAIAETAIGDVMMLRNELVIGYLLAGFAAALIPQSWLSETLHAIGAVPVVGYPLLLVAGLAIAVVTFVCSMGNVPIARFLADAGIPLGANTSFIYGDLLIPPLIGIYRKSFPERVTWTFVGLFALGAIVAGGLMESLIGGAFGGVSMGSMTLSERFTLISNLIALAAVATIGIVIRRRPRVA